MIKELVKDKEILTQKSKTATENDGQVIFDLLDTANSLENCYALSAIQIGYPVKTIVVKSPRGFVPFVNPIISKRSPKMMDVNEKCYSCGEAIRTRNDNITVIYTDITGKTKRQTFNGYMAACVQHSIEHFNGIEDCSKECKEKAGK